MPELTINPLLLCPGPTVVKVLPLARGERRSQPSRLPATPRGVFAAGRPKRADGRQSGNFQVKAEKGDTAGNSGMNWHLFLVAGPSAKAFILLACEQFTFSKIELSTKFI
jgi:hypothetical protein